MNVRKRKQMARLLAVAEAAYQAQLAQLAEIQAEQSRVQTGLDQLDEQRRQQVGGEADPELGSQFALGDVLGRYNGWVEKERARLLREMARIAASKEEQLEITRQAFGKTQALEALSKSL